ncbi:MAG TPA: retention module-containing protein, partial [Methylophilaceae bacterium]|nr:retention module-containing protein [Methylophilaceae bacterium]
MAILGKVQSISGVAYVISDSVQHQLRSGDVLESAGRLVTASDARIEILLDNGQIVRLGGDLLIPLVPDLDQSLVDDLSQQIIDKSFIRAILQGIERSEDIGALLEETAAGLAPGSQNNHGFNFVDLDITRDPATTSDGPGTPTPSSATASSEASLFSTPFSQQLYGQPLFTQTASQEPNRAPVAQPLSLLAFEASPLISGQMVARDADGDALLFSLAGVPQAGFVLNPDGSYLFDPQEPSYDSMAQGESLTTHYVWQVYDGKGGTDSATLDLTITGVNDAPTVANPLGDQLGIESHAFSYAFPANSFFDVDHSDVLHYTATRIDGTPLPAWLAFDDATRTLSGTPPLTASGMLDIRITATDPYGATAHEDFNLDIANLVLGTSGNNNLVGTADRDYIDALAGNDTLNGGLGADTMIGGTGNDTYVVDDAGDVVIENPGQGTDTVQSSVDHVLADNVERLILTGSGDLQGTGNLLDNTITGNGGNNLIDGGAGNDTMAGGLGDDIYVVDASSDVVTEAASAGIDTVRASASFTLGNNIENLILTGTGDINGTGNTLDNLILGNSGANTLNGGTGNDTMQGGEGDDVYVVNAVGDVVTENANEGIDLIQSSASIA